MSYPIKHLPFKPDYGNNVVLYPLSESAEVTIHKDVEILRFVNSGSNICYVKLSLGSSSATTNDIPIQSGKSLIIIKERDFDTVSYISASGTTLNMQTGSSTNLINTIEPDAPFLPILYGAKVWLDASDASTITEGTGVSQWDDKSGNNNHAVQATGSKQPTYNSTYSRIEFDGVDDGLKLTNPIAKANLSVIMVRNSSDAASLDFTGNRGLEFSFVSQDGQTTSGMYGRYGTPDLYVNNILQSVTNRDEIHTAINQGFDQIVLHKNADTLTFEWSDFFIGDYGAPFNFTGYYKEIIIFDRDLSEDERTQLFEYLEEKWFGDIEIFLLAGQSNMVGTATDNASGSYPDGTLQYKQSTTAIGPASTPLDHHDELSYSMGLARKFSIDYKAANSDSTIVFVPAAKGSSGFADSEWGVGDTYYNYALTSTAAVQALYPSATFKAILWHQGEDDELYDPDSYRTDLYYMIQKMRDTISGAESVPFILGEINASSNRYVKAINDIIKETSDYFPFTAVVNTQDLTLLGDNLHFDASSLDTMGSRYYSAIATALANTKVTAETGNTAHYLLGADNQLYYDLDGNYTATENDTALTHGPGYSTVVARNDGLDTGIAETAAFTMCFVFKASLTNSFIVGGNLGSTDGVSIYVEAGVLKVNGAGGIGVVTLETLVDEQWHFVAFSIDASGNYVFFRGGESNVIDTGSGTRGATTENLGIGDIRLNSVSYDDNCLVAEAIFFPTAKTAAELNTIYTASRTRMTNRNIDVKYEAALDPDEVTGLTAWYDFSDNTTITEDVGIETITDKANSYDMTQTTDANQPALLSAEKNGLDVADFDGSNDDMTYASTILTADNSYTKMVVVAFDNLTSAGNTFSMGRTAFYMNGGDVPTLYHATNQYASSDSLSQDTYYVLTVTYDSTTNDSYMYINQKQVGSDLTTATWDYSGNNCFLGSILGGNYLNGKLGEVCLWNKVLTEKERSDVVNGLIDKWDL